MQKPIWASFVWAACLCFPLQLVLSGEPPFTFEENLRVVPDDAWSGFNVTITADNKGRMYVAELEKCRIHVFDTTGRHLKTIGGKGEGPGQFQSLHRFSILEDGRSVALSFRMTAVSAHYFDTDLNFIEKRELSDEPLYGSPVQLSPNERQLSATVKLEKYRKRLTVFNRGGTPVTRFEETASGIPGKVRKTFEQQMLHVIGVELKQAEEGEPFIIFANDSSAFSAHHNQHEVVKWDQDMNQQWSVTLPSQKRPRPMPDLERLWMEYVCGRFQIAKLYTQAVFEKGLAKVTLRPFWPPISALVPTEDGGVFVVREHDPKSGAATADFVDADGKRQGSVALPKTSFSFFGGLLQFGPKLFLRNGHAYSLEPNDDFEWSLVRYRIIPRN